MAPTEQSVRTFQFERDTFAFPHELVWQYHFDPVTGAMTTFRSNPPPTYYHRCFVMVRSTRQFFYHARFEPELPAVEPEAYRRLIREIVSRDPRRACAESERVVVPGYDGLRSFSRAHEPLLKAELGGPWQSYFLRSHWRMIFRVSGRFQEKMAEKLKQSLPKRGLSPRASVSLSPHHHQPRHRAVWTDGVGTNHGIRGVRSEHSRTSRQARL